jgi:hypothetical protein
MVLRSDNAVKFFTFLWNLTNNMQASTMLEAAALIPGSIVATKYIICLEHPIILHFTYKTYSL